MNDPLQPAEVIRIGALEIRYLQHAGERRELGCFEMTVPPRAMVPPPHSHAGHEELVYVLKGTLRYTVDGATRDLQAGDTMAHRAARCTRSATRMTPLPARW